MGALGDGREAQTKLCRKLEEARWTYSLSSVCMNLREEAEPETHPWSPNASITGTKTATAILYWPAAPGLGMVTVPLVGHSPPISEPL